MDIKLKTAKNVADTANEIDYNLRHKELKRFNWWFKFTKTIKTIYLTWRF